MEEVKIKINADTSKATKEIEEFEKAILEVNEAATETKKGVESIDDGAKTASKGIRGIGTAIKAAGVGLFLVIFQKLGDLFSENQKVVDAMSTAMNALALVFNDFFNFIFDNVGSVVDTFKSVFEDPLGSIKSLGEAIKDNLIERLNSLVEVFTGVGSGLMKFFKGDFSGAVEEFKGAGKEMVDVFTGVDGSFDKTKEVLSEGLKSLGEYGDGVLELAKSQTQLANAARLAAAQQQVLVEQYDIQAESLRQVRDEERNSIADRKKANDELLITLNKQADEMRKLADLQVASAEADLKKNNNVENQIALTEALANKKGIEAQITGFLSEQKMNDLALDREQIELDKLLIQSKNELNISKKRFIAEGIKDEELRLMMLKEIDAEEAKLEEERLQRVINEAKEGTLARAEAESELAKIREENRQNEIIKEEELDLIRQEKENQKRMDEISMMENRFNQLVAENDLKNSINDQEIARLEAQTLKFKEGTEERAVAEAKLAHFKKMVSKDEERREKALSQAKLSMTADALGQIAGMLGENSKVGKAAAAAQAVINTYQGATKALSDLPPPFSYIAAAATIASGLQNVKQILSTKLPAPPSFAKGGGSTGGAIATPPRPPAFNIVGQSQTSQLAQTIASQKNEPVKAYVVADDVSTAQAMDRNIVEGASI